MAEDDFEMPSDSQETIAASQDSSFVGNKPKAGTKRKSQGGGKRGPGGGRVAKQQKCKQQSKQQQKDKEKKCFACPVKRMGNSKFCKRHHRPAENIHYQAQRDGQLDAYNHAFSDEGKALVALEDFIRENPEAGSRKKLIDWAQFVRRHGIKLSVTLRENDALWDIDDYYHEYAKKRDWDRARSDLKFKEAAQKLETEGTGANLKVWFPLAKTRMKDKTQYVDTAVH